MSIPVPAVKPTLLLSFSFDESASTINYSQSIRSVNFKGTANNGYMISIRLADPALSLFDGMITQKYFPSAMVKPQWMKWQLLGKPDGVYPTSATKPQIGIIVGVKSLLESGDSVLEITAIDPITHALSTGDASGKAYKGNISDAIRQVVNDYGRNVAGQDPVVEVTNFAGSRDMVWHMYRQDPKTFISSLLDWSVSLTDTKTRFLIGIDGNKLSINEQGKMPTKRRGYYQKFSGPNTDTIISHKIFANNYVSTVDNKLLTQGAGSTNGFYLDNVNDPSENFTVVTDRTTNNKYVPRVANTKAFTKADSTVGKNIPYAGSTAIMAIPELLSNGEIGVPYENYIDGRARNQYYKVANNGLRMVLRVFGHGEYSDTIGLGADTAFVAMQNMSTTSDISYFWNTGAWIVDGFHHIMTINSWYTDLNLLRLESNASGRKVGV